MFLRLCSSAIAAFELPVDVLDYQRGMGRAYTSREAAQGAAIDATDSTSCQRKAGERKHAEIRTASGSRRAPPSSGIEAPT